MIYVVEDAVVRLHQLRCRVLPILRYTYNISSTILLYHATPAPATTSFAELARFAGLLDRMSLNSYTLFYRRFCSEFSWIMWFITCLL